MRDRGLDASYEQTDLKTFQTRAGSASGAMSEALVTEIIDDCGAKFTQDVGLVFNSQLSGGLSPGEEAKACLIDAGLIPADATSAEANEAFELNPNVGIECLIKSRTTVPVP